MSNNDNTDSTDESIRGAGSLLTRRELLGSSAALGTAAIASGVSVDTVMAQSGGPSDEISGTVEDDDGAVDGATVVAVPHDTSLAALETATDASGDYIFEQADLHEDSNLYHVIARDGTESDPRRGVPNYPFIAAEGPPSIPDSEANQKLRHRWLLDESSGSTVEDSVGGLDGSVNGGTWVDGDWAGDAALSGDGTDDYVDIPSLGDYSQTITNSAVSFSIQTTDGDAHIFGEMDADSQRLDGALGLSDADSGELWIRYASDGIDARLRAYTDNANLADGNPHRVVINIDHLDSPDGMTVFVDGSEQSLSIQDDDTPVDGWGDFGEGLALLARNNQGSIQDHINGILDDFCLFDESLTEAEVTSYDDPWA